MFINSICIEEAWKKYLNILYKVTIKSIYDTDNIINKVICHTLYGMYIDHELGYNACGQ